MEDSKSSSRLKAPPSFIASPTWNGSKPGYVFTTRASSGTGYYLDDDDVNGDKKRKSNDGKEIISSKRPAVVNNGNMNGGASRKRARKSVQIMESHNETRLISSRGEQLLAQAEEQQQNTGLLLDPLTRKNVQRAAAGLSKAILNNERDRELYPTQPARYMASEVTLYEHIESLKAMAADPAVAYPVANNNNDGTSIIMMLLELLGHANVDMAAATVATLLELVEATLVLNDDDDDDEVEGKGATVVLSVVDLARTVLEHGAEPLVSNLQRLQQNVMDDEDNSDGGGTTDTKGSGAVLTLFENLIEMENMIATATVDDNDDTTHSTTLLQSGQSAAAYVCRETSLLGWLFQTTATVAESMSSTNKDEDDGDKRKAMVALGDRALEVLASMSPYEDAFAAVPNWSQIPPYVSSLNDDGDDNGKDKTKKGPKFVDGIEILLQIVGSFRKRQPSDEAEIERLENACLVMTSALTYSVTNIRAFLDAQGIELVLRCVKERVHAGGVALKWLDLSGGANVDDVDHHGAENGSSSRDVNVYKRASQHLVEAGALKYLLPVLMGKHLPKPSPASSSGLGEGPAKKVRKTWRRDVETTCIRILYTLTRYIDENSPNDCQARLLAKFATDSAKCNRIVDLLLLYDAKARNAEYKFYRSDVEESLIGRDGGDGEGEVDDAVELAAQEAKLAGGGDLFQRLGAIAAFLCSGSQRCHAHILQHLQTSESGMGLVHESASAFCQQLEPGQTQRTQLETYLKEL